MRQLLNALSPFIIFAIVVILIAFGAMVIGYLLIFGFIIGMVLFIIKKIRSFLRPKPSFPKQSKNKSGRIIDADDWNVL